MNGFPQAAVRIGTRGSPLALAQAHETRERLLAEHPMLAGAGVEVVVIRTSGDRIQDRALADAGGKGLFTKELEEALIDGRIELAVHSMKDVPTVLPAGLAIGCVLPREDPRDVLISRQAAAIAALPQGAVVGTASLRRQAQLLHRRPDLRVVTFRGNVESRLRKLAEGTVAATLLALAGLKRLALADHATAVLDTSEMLPAVAQGAIGIECRADDQRIAALLQPLDHAPSGCRVAAERAMLAVLDGSCRTPIAGLAEFDESGALVLRGQVLRPDGSQSIETTLRGDATDARRLGAEVGAELKARAGPDFFTA